MLENYGEFLLSVASYTSNGHGALKLPNVVQ